MTRCSVRAKTLLFPLLACLSLLGAGVPAFGIEDDEFLPPEQAFTYKASAEPAQLTIEWQAIQGYYLYKKRMGLESATPGVTIGAPVYPKGESHSDEYFGEQEIFRGNFTVTAPLTGAKPGDTVAVKLKWQGCADAGLCYPPSVWDATVKVAGATSTADKIFDNARDVAQEEEDYLDPEVAFVLTAEAKSVNDVQLNWRIAEGYYLYKQRMKLEPVDAARPVGAIVLPKGESHYDEYFGDQEIYRLSVDGSFSVPPGAKSVDVNVTYQGCADAGLCYPPITKTLTVSLEGAPAAISTANSPSGGEFVSEQDSYAEKIKNGNLFLVLASFFGAGLLLAFTPCVLPMVPILSGIIAGGGENISTRRSFMLSVSYVLGMAFTYTAAGIAAGAIGQGFNLQATFNQPWIVTVFSLLFVVLAASMLGLFTIEMPGFIQTRLSNASNDQQAGTYLGVGVMGALSALIVSACVAPPLIAALTVISQTGDVVRGGAALFVMSIGMGTPLLLVGASAGKLLPRAGAWMDTVKNLFGVLFLAVAAWMLSRIVPGWLSMIFWAAPAMVLAWVLWNASARNAPARNLSRALATAAGIYGIALLAGAALGSSNPLAPIPQLAGEQQKQLEFKRIKSVADLEREVAAASQAGRTVMLDFYADWCVSCKEMEHYTFTEAEVQSALGNTTLLQADVTANDEQDRALLKHFGIFGPPTIAFYGADGKERRNFRVVGFMKAAEFAAVVRQAVASGPPAT
jgi:thiol:disulfide interchange protein DsbD